MRYQQRILFQIILLIVLGALLSACGAGATTDMGKEPPKGESESAPVEEATPTAVKEINPYEYLVKAQELCNQESFSDSKNYQAAAGPYLILFNEGETFDVSALPNEADAPTPAPTDFAPYEKGVLAGDKTTPPQAVICIRQSQILEAEFVIYGLPDPTTGTAVPTERIPATQATWDVSVISLADGGVLGQRSFLGAPPPATIAVGSDWADHYPHDMFAAWLLGKPVIEYGNPIGGDANMDVSPDGKTLFAVNDMGTLEFRDTATNALKAMITSTMGAVSVAVSPDGKQLAVGQFDNKINIISLDSYETVKTLSYSAETNRVEALAFSPDGKMLVSAGSGCDLRLWNLDSGDAIESKPSPCLTFEKAAFSPDGKTFATATSNAAVTLWKAEDGKMIKSFTSGDPDTSSDYSRAIAYWPDSSALLSGDTDPQKGIHIWDAATGKPLGTQATDGPVFSLAFSPDGKTLAAGLADGNLVFFEAGPDHSLTQKAVKTAAELKIVNRSYLPVYTLNFNNPDSEKEFVALMAKTANAIRAIKFSRDGRMYYLGGSIVGEIDAP